MAGFAFEMFRRPRLVRVDEIAKHRLSEPSRAFELHVGNRQGATRWNVAVPMGIDTDEQIAVVDLLKRLCYCIPGPRPEHFHPDAPLSEPLERLRDLGAIVDEIFACRAEEDSYLLHLGSL